MVNTIFIGNAAESDGVDFLKKQRYKILNKNYRSPFGEIDIIAKDKNDLVCIEVKYRSSSDFGRPEEFVDKKKQLKIIKTALHYIKKKQLTKINVRFDVLAIHSDSKKINLIKSAFGSPSLYKY